MLIYCYHTPLLISSPPPAYLGVHWPWQWGPDRGWGWGMFSLSFWLGLYLFWLIIACCDLHPSLLAVDMFCEWMSRSGRRVLCVEAFNSLVHKFVFWSVGRPYFVNENPLCWCVWIFVVLYLNVASFIFKLFFFECQHGLLTKAKDLFSCYTYKGFL